jgi:hypothetical protein
MPGQIRDALKRQDYLFLGLEVIVVIFSIFVAFQIDRWAEDGRERKEEQNYLLRLKEDMQIEIAHMDEAEGYARERIEAALLLEKIASDPAAALVYPAALARAVETASWLSFPNLNAFVYSELLNSGNLALVRSDKLRRALAEHYATFHHNSRIGLARDVQIRFDRETAGILSSEELRIIEERTWQNLPYDISTRRAAEIAEQFIRKPVAIALIPSIVQHHVFNVRAIEQTRNSALAIIDQIDHLLAGF